MRVLLLVSAFNGLSQRVWCALRETGHDVGVLLATEEQAMIDVVRAVRPDLILCPFLKHRVPSEIWRPFRTVIIHPGPVGDRGPSSLDWAITEGARFWGVTALQAIDEMDAGPVWAWRTFPMPDRPHLRKSALYNGPVADAALECVHEVLAKAASPGFAPTPLEQMHIEVPGARLRPMMRQDDRAFDWGDSTDRIITKLKAGDGSPGTRTEIAGMPVYAYDAHPGGAGAGTANQDAGGPGGPGAAKPGTVILRRHGAVLVTTGDGSVWLGHLRAAELGTGTGTGVPAMKLPATTLLGARLRGVPHSPLSPQEAAEVITYRQIHYRRSGKVGWLTFDFYNGAMSAGHCRRLLAALRHAAAQDTRVLILCGGTEAFSNGIHLNVIEAAADPAATAWANIRAINEVCREIITCTRQVMVTAFTGGAGAGGVMLALGADVVAARSGIVLNPYYDIGLYGSELHTYTLPRRVGEETADRLLRERLPITPASAAGLGLVDEVGPRHPEAFMSWLAELAQRYAEPARARKIRGDKARRLTTGRVPLAAYEARELAEMSRDMFDDRSGFAAARKSFVFKTPPDGTPARLAFSPPPLVPAPRRAVPAPVPG